MGGRSSRASSIRSNSSSSWSGRHAQSPYGHERQSYAPQQFHPHQQPPPPPQNHPSPQENYGGAMENRRRLERRYSRIADDYNSLEQGENSGLTRRHLTKHKILPVGEKPAKNVLLKIVSSKVTEALAHAGLESSNLIVGIDFTKSNEWTGTRSFNRRSLHHISDGLNPYQQAISIIGKTLAAFDEDNLIPCFGFGDASTHDQDVFSFFPDERFCNGFEEVLDRYREIVPHLRLAGPTSFAPVVEMAMTIVEQSGGQYHVLLIIADGQVTRSVDTASGGLSPQEQKTVDAIVEASKYPLSIVLVGVGDGPWDMMREFDDNIPSRAFDNFQFVNFTEIMSKNVSQTRKETEFALSALMEIPSQYKATIELNILGGRRGNAVSRVPLPTPMYGGGSFVSSWKSFSGSKPSQSGTSNKPSVPPYPASPLAASSDIQLCPICISNPKDMAFGCGHQTCCECGEDLQTCPLCRSAIQTRIKLY